jgi:hypothetical protein
MLYDLIYLLAWYFMLLAICSYLGLSTETIGSLYDTAQEAAELRSLSALLAYLCGNCHEHLHAACHLLCRSGQHILHAAEAILAHDGLPALHKPLKAMRPVTGHVRHVSGCGIRSVRFHTLQSVWTRWRMPPCATTLPTHRLAAMPRNDITCLHGRRSLCMMNTMRQNMSWRSSKQYGRQGERLGIQTTSHHSH